MSRSRGGLVVEHAQCDGIAWVETDFTWMEREVFHLDDESHVLRAGVWQDVKATDDQEQRDEAGERVPRTGHADPPRRAAACAAYSLWASGFPRSISGNYPASAESPL